MKSDSLLVLEKKSLLCKIGPALRSKMLVIPVTCVKCRLSVT